MKISVLGAGAIGSMIGGLIKQHRPEADVLLIARGAHGEAMQRQQYVELRGPWGVFTPNPRISNDIREIAGSDHVLFTVKSQDTQTVIEAARPHFGQAVVTSIQNGINHRTLAQYVSEDRLVMGMTVSNMAVLEPGSVTLQLAGLTAIGPCPGQPMTPAATQAYEILQWSQLPIQLHKHILGMQYNKLLISCLGCASAISKLHFVAEGLFHRGWRRSVAWPIYSECLSVLERAGIQLAPVPGSTDASRFRFLMKALDRRLLGAIIRLVETTVIRRKSVKFSVGEDLDRNKATEVDFINGEIVRLAQACGTSAPYNALVVELVHQLEQSSDIRAFPREVVIEQFQRSIACVPSPHLLGPPRPTRIAKNRAASLPSK